MHSLYSICIGVLYHKTLIKSRDLAFFVQKDSGMRIESTYRFFIALINIHCFLQSDLYYQYRPEPLGALPELPLEQPQFNI